MKPRIVCEYSKSQELFQKWYKLSRSIGDNNTSGSITEMLKYHITHPGKYLEAGIIKPLSELEKNDKELKKRISIYISDIEVQKYLDDLTEKGYKVSKILKSVVINSLVYGEEENILSYYDLISQVKWREQSVLNENYISANLPKIEIPVTPVVKTTKTEKVKPKNPLMDSLGSAAKGDFVL